MEAVPAAAPTAAPSHSTAELRDLFARLQGLHPHVARQGAAVRADKLRRLRQAVLDHRNAIREACRLDLRKPQVETDMTEVGGVAGAARHAARHVEGWMAPERVATPPLLFGTRSEVQYQPKGVVLIMAPWNYPVLLALEPLVSAVAAGCSVVLKPSEMTPHSARAVQQVVESVFDPREVAVVQGGKGTAQELLELPFDHIFFTGSPRVGKIVMRAAAEHLTSVTLELGGKSPAVVDASADVEDAAAKLAWGKFSNAGQTCIAPDFVLVHRYVHDELVHALRARVRKQYGHTEAEQRASEDYARIVNEQHAQRLLDLVDDARRRGARIELGGTGDAAACYVAPTLLTHVPHAADVMQDEIFGPVLPILRYDHTDDALRLLREGPSAPLALYLFSRDDRTTNRLLRETRSGATVVNDVMLHFLNHDLPFGGLGHSGMGRAHGFAGFRAFSNERGVMQRQHSSWLPRLFYPPYNPLVHKATDLATRWL